MSTRSRSTAATDAVRKKEKKRNGKFRRASEEPVLEVVEERRGSLVSERQDTMKGVLESHDTLVRELFHLEKFVDMTKYDPKVAKEDTSPVWNEYQAKYDLVSKTASAGPSRITRGALNAKFDSLISSSDAVELTPTSSRKKAKVQETTDGADHWTAISDIKPRDKGKRRADPDAPLFSASTTTVRRGRPKAAQIPSRDIPTHKGHVLEAQNAQTGKLRQRKRPPDVDLASSEGQDFNTPSTRKRRKIDSQDDMPPPESISVTLKRTPRASRSETHLDLTSNSLDPPDTTSLKTPKRRVTLIVRRPQPMYSNWKQLPRPPQYNSSISTLLTSYRSLDDICPGEESEDAAISKQLTFWSQVDKARQEGKLEFLPYLESISETNGQYVRGATPEPKRTPDVWDDIIDEVVSGQGKPVVGAEVAKDVASRVRTYWTSRGLEGIGGEPLIVRERHPMKGKVKGQELARLKKLAKTTADAVKVQWRRVVQHLRAEEALRRQEEEQRLGKQHLDAILHKSGRILEAQQADLTRNLPLQLPRTSRSSSARSLASQNEGDVEEEELEDSDDDTEAPESDDDVDTGFLLGGDVSFASLRRSQSVESGELERQESSVPGEDEDFSTAAPPSETVETPAEAEDGPSVHPSSPDETPQTPLPEDDHHLPMIVQEFSHSDRLLASLAPPPQLAYEKHSSITQANGHIPHDIESDRPSSPAQGSPDDETTAEDVQQPLITDLTIAGLPETAEGTPTAELDIPADDEDDDVEVDASIPSYLHPYAVAPVEWDPQSKIQPPQLLRGTLRPYQQAGLEWLASLHTSGMNGILADEMGLGKTIQTIALLAHLACDRGIWGPHLIIVPTSVLLNWEMEFKKFLPGFKILSYHGNAKERKDLRQGWFNKYGFNVCVTSYAIAARDQGMLKRKPWYYMILDEAHMIKNFKSQRWAILLNFMPRRRLLLTGTPLQNNLTELWALLQFLMIGTEFANLKEFSDWFSNPLEKAIEMSAQLDEDTQQRVAKLHTVLRPYLLRRLKRDVEKELPSKYEHLVMCSLSKRQRFLYDEFMSRAETRHDLQSGHYQKIANILMQLRKVVNHPDLFEVRPIKTSFVMQRSAIADFEIEELLIRRRFLQEEDVSDRASAVEFFNFVEREPTSLLVATETRRLDASHLLPHRTDRPGVAPPTDTRTITGYRKYRAWQQRKAAIEKWQKVASDNHRRCIRMPLICEERIAIAKSCVTPLVPLSAIDRRYNYLSRVDRIPAAVKTHMARAEDMAEIVDRFSFVTPMVVARGMPSIALAGAEDALEAKKYDSTFDAPLHRSSVKLQIAFPDPSLLQYDCGKLQRLAQLLRERKAGGHRVLIFTQMTRVLDILEIFLNLHGYLYLRLDGATKIEDRQYITERFNSDARVFCFISSSRSGGVGINLTGADTVIFYDSDFNPQMDRQCEDRAHRIGQIRDVHIYRLISQYTVEEALLRKANQKRSLDDIVIQQGEFDWRTVLREKDEGALTRALGEFDDVEDARAAEEAAKEEVQLVGADEVDFNDPAQPKSVSAPLAIPTLQRDSEEAHDGETDDEQGGDELGGVEQVGGVGEGEDDGEEGEGGTVDEYMIAFIRSDWEHFSTF